MHPLNANSFYKNSMILKNDILAPKTLDISDISFAVLVFPVPGGPCKTIYFLSFKRYSK
jgi:hypothetical protein